MAGFGWVREVRTVKLQRELAIDNNARALRTQRLLAELGVTMLNVAGASGAGKTSLLEATVRRLRGRLRLIALLGDAASLDVKRIQAAGCPVHAIQSGAACHLDAAMIAEALAGLTPEPGTLVLVENVSNLVCPSLFGLGEHAKVILMSVTQGEAEPLKRARLFATADVLVITKTDLLPHLAFDTERCVANARSVNPRLRIVMASTVEPRGIDGWCAWVERQLSRAG